jgi:hypothetical protein
MRVKISIFLERSLKIDVGGRNEVIWAQPKSRSEYFALEPGDDEQDGIQMIEKKGDDGF